MSLLEYFPDFLIFALILNLNDSILIPILLAQWQNNYRRESRLRFEIFVGLHSRKKTEDNRMVQWIFAQFKTKC